MNAKIKKHIDGECGLVGYGIKISPETEEDKDYLKSYDLHTEIFFDEKGNLRIFI